MDAALRKMNRAELIAEIERLLRHCAELDPLESLRPELEVQAHELAAQQHANLVGCSLLGIQRTHLLGLPLHSFVLESDRPIFLDHLHRCGVGAGQVSSEVQIKSRAGSVLPVLLTSRLAVTTGDTKIIRTVMTDLTERRLAEQEIRNLNAHLEQRVWERTAAFERANEDLRHEVIQRQAAEASLQRANRLKDEFLAMLGHELRNPLAPLRHAIDIWRLTTATDRDESEQIQAIAERQVRHIAQLVDDLLDVSRISRGKIALRKRPINLVALLNDVVSDFSVRLHGNDLLLRTELPKAPIWVDADPTRLSQVIGNLLHNANKFTPRGGAVNISLSANQSCRLATIKVRDTGIGIESEHLERIFTTFYQSDRSLDRSFGGLGLGLALVKGLIDLHGGKVSASSGGKDRGTEITIELSTCPAPVDQSDVAPVRPNLRRYRILVIDDQRDALITMNALLARLGHDVITAQNGEDALEAVAKFHPDVVFSDIGLPGMDGYTIARRMRSDPNLHAGRLIAVTGYGQASDKERAFEAGFDQHMTKPVAMAELSRVLEDLPQVELQCET